MKHSPIFVLMLSSMVAGSLSQAQQPTGLSPAIGPPSVANIQSNLRFKQTMISTCAGLPRALHFGRSTLQYAEGDLSVSGVDSSGRPYTAVKGTSVAGCEIWSADFDGNGTPDLAILSSGNDSSGGYDSELSLLFFDATGRPMPWQAVGKFNADAHGIRQIIAGVSRGRASVIVPTKEGLTGPEANLAFQLYSFAPSSAAKTTGDALGLTWPVFQNASPLIKEHQEASSLSFDSASQSKAARLLGNDGMTVMATSMLALDNGQQTEPPAIIVKDDTKGSRHIIFDPVPADVSKLLSEHAKITAMGRSCEEEECRPFILIANP